MKEYIVQAIAQETIDSFDAHNAPELIRCKDCKYGYRCKNAAGEDCVECSNHYVSLESVCRKPGWFCADGVAKDIYVPDKEGR